MTRQRRDPSDKAQEALDVALRKTAKIRARQMALNTELRELDVELALAEAVAAHLSHSPYLTPATVDTPREKTP